MQFMPEKLTKPAARLTYSARIDRLVEVNASFDKGVLRVAYVGKNRNMSCISKEAFLNSISTIYNCPIVCNYDRETDSIGSHDIEVVKDGNSCRVVNVTQPVGVIPESAEYWFETVTEDNGDVHEYLCVEALLWKRQEAYNKIKSNVITDESMEIAVNSAHMEDGYYYIDSFDFTAFCLLESAEPCFESASLMVYSTVAMVEAFHEEFTRMMQDFKDSFTQINSSGEDLIDLENSKGGIEKVEYVEKLIAEFGLNADELDFDPASLSEDELRAKFEQLTGKPDTYTLTAMQLMDELSHCLGKVIAVDPFWGDAVPQYFFVDYDAEKMVVYAADITAHWQIYGFKYTLNGDYVNIDFDSKYRVKTVYEPFVEGDTAMSFECAVNALSDIARQMVDNSLASANDQISQLQNEVTELRDFKNTKIHDEFETAVNQVFEQFTDLEGVEAFEQIRANHADMDIQAIENKCYEIRGRKVPVGTNAQFSAQRQPIRIGVPAKEEPKEDEPYGDLFLKYNK